MTSLNLLDFPDTLSLAHQGVMIEHLSQNLNFEPLAILTILPTELHGTSLNAMATLKLSEQAPIMVYTLASGDDTALQVNPKAVKALEDSANQLLELMQAPSMVQTSVTTVLKQIAQKAGTEVLIIREINEYEIIFAGLTEDIRLKLKRGNQNKS